MTTRLRQLRARMDSQGLPALLVTSRENIFYLSGFSLSLFDDLAAALLITHDQQYLVSDFRFRLQAEHEAPDWTFILSAHTLYATLRATLESMGHARVGFDTMAMTVAQHQLLCAAPAPPYTLTPAAGLVEELRAIKSAEELAQIRHAARITDIACEHVMRLARPGVSERDLALEAEWCMRREGADGVAFDLIIASGERAAQPHATPGARTLQPGDLVIADMGARVNHYCADLTRSFAVAESTPLAQEIYEICYRAQMAGLTQIHAGLSGREADRIVREVIETAGYGEQFGHGTGHGVGLEVHEAPRLSRMWDRILPAGAVVTVEPGIYLPDVGGVRIEDLAVLTDEGLTCISQAVKPATLPIYGG